MSKSLTQAIQNQIDDKVLDIKFLFKINGTNYTSYVKSWDISFDKNYGSAAATFTLLNVDGIFSDDGSSELFIGDTVELIEYYQSDPTNEFKKFYGVIKQRNIVKQSNNRTIALQCLDYISILKDWNLNLAVEGTKEEVRNEELSPVYLSAPNESLAQLFNFANNSVAASPMPLVKFQDRNHEDFTDDQFDGFQIYYDVGQLLLGAPLNVLDNYKVLATYYHYTRGLFIEDVIETILIQPDGYGNYLFGESTPQAIIDNHLTETFQNVEGAISDLLVPNLVDFEADVEHQLTADFAPLVSYSTTLASDYKANEEDYDETIMYLTDTSDFIDPEAESGITSATAKISAYTITYTGLGSGNTLTGVTVTPIPNNFNAGLTITQTTTEYNTEIYVDDVAGFPIGLVFSYNESSEWDTSGNYLSIDSGLIDDGNILKIDI